MPTKEVKIKERQDKFLKAQLEKEREQALLEEIEKTEKERVKKKGTVQFCYNWCFLLCINANHGALLCSNLGLKTLKQSGILEAY